MKSQYTGVKRILKAFTYSFDGFKASFKSEVAFRQDLLVCFVLFILSFFLKVSIYERISLISSLLIVLLMELTNTAIEVIIDRISDDYHELSKKAKDIGSLLVLLGFLNMIMVWGMVLLTN